MTPRIRTSSDNGGTWDAGSSDYAISRHRVDMTTSAGHTVVGNAGLGYISFFGNNGNLANELNDVEITLFNPSSTEYTKFKWEGIYSDDDPAGFTHYVGAGVRKEAAAVNGVRFIYESGNIATGTLWVYGIRA